MQTICRMKRRKYNFKNTFCGKKNAPKPKIKEKLIKTYLYRKIINLRKSENIRLLDLLPGANKYYSME